MKNTSQAAQYCKEQDALERFLDYRLDSRWKMIGIYSAVAIFIFLIAYKFYGSNELIVKDLCRTLILFFLLVASLSNDVIDDEYVRHRRSQSYVIAFTAALGYAIIIPTITYVLDVLICRITGDGTPTFHEVSAFQVMFMLVAFQLLFFEALKRFGCAE